MLLIGLALPQAGCGAGWRRIDPQAPAALPKRQQVQVWQAGRVIRLHAVEMAADSLTGVPYLRPPDCDSCRVALGRQKIDSIRSGNPSAGFWKTVGLSLAGVAVAALVICGASSSCILEAD